PRPIRIQAPDVPAAIEAFTLRLLAKDPGRRIASTEQLEHELAALGADLPDANLELGPEVADTATPDRPMTHSAVTTLSSAAGTGGGPGRAPRVPAAIAGGLVLAVAAIVVWRIAHTDEPAPPPPTQAPAPARAPTADAAVARASSLISWLEAANP